MLFFLGSLKTFLFTSFHVCHLLCVVKGSRLPTSTSATYSVSRRVAPPSATGPTWTTSESCPTRSHRPASSTSRRRTATTQRLFATVPLCAGRVHRECTTGSHRRQPVRQPGVQGGRAGHRAGHVHVGELVLPVLCRLQLDGTHRGIRLEGFAKGWC